VTVVEAPAGARRRRDDGSRANGGVVRPGLELTMLLAGPHRRAVRT
jgi:hypothetical protein